MMEEIYTGSSKRKLPVKNLTLQPYVLTDFSIVITKKSLNRYFGHSGQSDWINDYMHGFARYGIGATGLLAQLSAPILFKATNKDGFPTIEEGYTIQTVIEVCEFILFAKREGFLSVIELKIAKIAESLIEAHRARPFKHEIAEITGLNLLKWKAQQQILAAMSKKQKDDAFKWIVAIPDEFWTILFADQQTDWRKIIKRSTNPARFVFTWIFARLSEETMEKLRKSEPKRTYRTKNGLRRQKMPELEAYAQLFIGLYEISSRNFSILEQLLDKTHPVRRSANFEDEPTDYELVGFAKNLSEALTGKRS